MTRERNNLAARWLYGATVGAALTAAAWGQPPPPPPPAPTATATNAVAPGELAAPPVPETALAQLRAQMVAPDDSMSDVKKMRRYRAILRGGQDLEGQYAGAENLYIVYSLMLEAMRGLVVLQADDVTPDQIMEVARKIVDSAAPGPWRIGADVLLTQREVTRLAEEAPPPPEPERPHGHKPVVETPVEKSIRAFAERYEGMEVYPDALMNAITMAQQVKAAGLVKAFADELEYGYYEEPRVRVFLRETLGRVHNGGQSVVGDLPLLDGKTLCMPRDLFGKAVLVHFWSPKATRSLKALDALKAVYTNYHDKGFEIVSVCVDRGKADLEHVVKTRGLPWLQVYSGKGADDYLIKAYGVQTVPSFWVVGRDGRIVADIRPHNEGPLKEVMERLRDAVEGSWRMAAWLDACRSGEYLTFTFLDRPSPDGPAPSVPAQTWKDLADTVQAAYLAFPADRKAPLMQEVRKRCEAAAHDFPGAAEVPNIRSLGLIATQWLAAHQGDRALEAEAVAQARSLLDSKPPLAVQALADFVLTRSAVLDGNADERQDATRIREYSARYEHTDDAWMAAPMATVLALEAGQWRVADDLRRTMTVPAMTRHPEIRAAMRTAFGWGFDRDEPFSAVLAKLDGGALNLPADLLGQLVVVHFWSATAPPAAPWALFTQGGPASAYRVVETRPGMAIVAVNLDRTPGVAEEMARKHPDWIVTWSGLGAGDPLARRYAIYGLPATWVIGRDGRVLLTDSDLDVCAPLSGADNATRQAAHASTTKLDPWWASCSGLLWAKEKYDAIDFFCEASQMTGGRLQNFENASEHVVRSGFAVLEPYLANKDDVLCDQLGQLVPVGQTKGGWGPTNVVKTANAAIAAILDAKHKLETALTLRAGMPWAEAPDVADLVRTAQEADCLRVPATADAESRRKMLAQFFEEVRVPPATTNAALAVRLFRVKPL